METPAEIAAKELEQRQAELEAARSATVARQTAKDALAKVQGKETIDLAGSSVTRISPDTSMIDYSASYRTDTGALVTDKAYISSDIPAGGVTMRLGQDDRVVFDTAAIGENRTIRLDQRGNGKLAFAIPEGSDFNVQYDEKTRTATMVIERDGKTQTIKVEGVSNLDELEVGTLDRANNRISSFATVGQVQAQQKADDKVADQSKEDAIAAAQAKVDAAQTTVDEIEATRPAVPEPGPAPREAEPTTIDDAIDRNIAAQEAIRAFRGEEPMTADEKAEEKKNLKEGGSTVAEFNESTRELEGQLKAMEGYKAAFEAKAIAEGKDPKAEWEAQVAQTGDIMGRGASEAARVSNGSLTAEQINVRTEDLKNPEAKNKAMDSYAQSINDYRKAVGLREVPVDGLRASVAGGTSGEITENAKAWSDAAKEAAKYKEKFFQVAEAQGKDPQKEWDAQSKIPNSEVQQVISGRNAETIAALTAAMPTPEATAAQTRNAAMDRYITSLNAYETAAGLPVTTADAVKANPAITNLGTEDLDKYTKQWDDTTKAMQGYKDKFLQVQQANGKNPDQALAEWNTQAATAGTEVYKITHKQVDAAGIAAATNALPDPKVVSLEAQLNAERTARAELELRGKYEGKMGTYMETQANYARQVLGKSDAEAKQYGLEAGRGLEVQMANNPDPTWRKAHTEAMIGATNQKLADMQNLRTQYLAYETAKGVAPDEAEKKWKASISEFDKQDHDFLKDHAARLHKDGLSAGILREPLMNNYQAHGMNPQEAALATQREIDRMQAENPSPLQQFDPSQGAVWQRNHAAALNRDASHARDVVGYVNTYADAIGASPEQRKALIGQFANKADGMSDAQYRDGINNGTGPANEVARMSNAAQQYRQTFNAKYTEAGLNPDEIQKEWERQSKDPSSAVARLQAGSLNSGQINNETTALRNTDTRVIKSEIDVRKLREELSTRPVTPATPAVAGSAAIIDNDGKFVGMATLTRDGDKTIAKDAEGRALTAGTVITATVDNGSGAKTNERFTVREGGEIQAPTGASVGGLPPAGRSV